VADCIPTAEDDEVWTDWETDISGQVQASGAYAGDVLSFQLTVPAEHGTAEVDVHGYWQYRPVTGYTGADRFVVEVHNSYGETALAEIRVHITYPISPPIITGPLEFTVNEGNILAGSINAVSPIGSPLSFTLIDNAEYGNVHLNDSGEWIYTPESGFVGIDRFLFLVRDDYGQSTFGTITITVLHENKKPSAPIVLSPTGTDVFIDGDTIPIKWAESVDPDGDPIVYKVELWDGIQWLVINESITVNEVAYDLVNTEIMTQEAHIRVTASDGELASTGLSAPFSILDQQIRFDFFLNAAGQPITSGHWTNSDVTVDIIDRSNAITDVYYDISAKDLGLQWQGVISPWQGNFSQAGIYQIVIRGYDGWGNEMSKSLTICIDKEAPPLPVAVLSPGVDTMGPVEVNLMFSRDDSLSGIQQIMLDGQVISQGFKKEVRVSISRNGRYEIIVQDRAGNSNYFVLPVTNIFRYLPAVELTSEYNKEKTILSGEITCNVTADSREFLLYSVTENSDTPKIWYPVPEGGFLIEKEGAWNIHYWLRCTDGHEKKGFWGPFSVEEQIYIDIQIISITETTVILELATELQVEYVVVTDGAGNRYVFTDELIEISLSDSGSFVIEVHDKSGNMWTETLTVRENSDISENDSARQKRESFLRSGIRMADLSWIAVLLLLVLYRMMMLKKGINVYLMADTDRGVWTAEHTVKSFDILENGETRLEIRREFDDVVVNRIKVVINKALQEKLEGRTVRVVYLGKTVAEEVISTANGVWDILVDRAGE
jgi:hypothetical protein